MEYRSATGRPPRQTPAFGFQKFGLAFSPGVLVTTDHDGVFVLPQVKDCLQRFFLRASHLLQQIVFQSQVEVRVMGVAFDDQGAHACHPPQVSYDIMLPAKWRRANPSNWKASYFAAI